MAINQIYYGNTELINLQNDTITAEDVCNQKTFHQRDGTIAQGTNTYDADTSDANATAGNILRNKTAYSKGVKLTGTMTNRGAVTAELTTQDGVYKILKGYHNGNGTVAIAASEQDKIIGENIKTGISILGTNGTFTSDADATATDILLNKTAYVNGTKLTGTMLNYNNFPLFAQTYKRFTVTLSANQASFPLDAVDLGGRPIKFIFIFAYGTMSGISRSTSGTSSPFICYLNYFRDITNTGFYYNANGGRASWFGLSAKIAYNTSKVASLNNQIIGTGTGFTIENENLLSSGGATVTTSNPAFYGYFLRDCLYSAVVGG